MTRGSVWFAASVGLLCASITLEGQQPPKVQPRYTPYEEARPILEVLREILPPELGTVGQVELPEAWGQWVARRDGEIRARLAQGDEDAVVNFLLFGTSFTRQPRVTANDLLQLTSEGQSKGNPLWAAALGQAFQVRLDDLARALAAPGPNERVLFALRVVEQKGINPRIEAGRAATKEYLLTSLRRVLSEQAGYARALEAARQLGSTTEEFAERSKLYRDRGLSLDTSLAPNYAIEESLKAIQARGLLRPGQVRRVAVIGPGLDFTDKQDGYDFYPQQTLQPFAVADSLIRLGLATPNALHVTTLDLSPRVNDHLARARQRALRGAGYTLQLPRNLDRQWKPKVVAYWKRFGDQIGVPVTPVPVPANAGGVEVRAVRIRAGAVARVVPEDVNIVLQRWEEQSGGGFDLIVATNIFVYYDLFEQCLALKNIEHMLRPGGFLLSNNALLELPSSRVRSAGYLTTVYSDRPDDGDHIVWYQRR